MQLQHWHLTRLPPPSHAPTTNTLAHQKQPSAVNNKESHLILGSISSLGGGLAPVVALVADTARVYAAIVALTMG